MGISYQNKPLPEPFVVYIPNFNFERFLEYANEDIDCELLNGVLVIHSPASLNHELIFKFLLGLLDRYTQEFKLGLVVGSRFTMKLSSLWAPEPDLMFILPNLNEHLQSTYLDGPASVVFEILSPTNRDDDLNKKLPSYINMGVNEIWIIDPELQELTVYWSLTDFSTQKTGWIESKIISGFQIQVEWLWNVQKESVNRVYQEILEKVKGNIR